MPRSPNSYIIGLGKGSLVDGKTNTVKGIDIKDWLSNPHVGERLAVGYLVLINQHVIVIDGHFKTFPKFR